MGLEATGNDDHADVVIIGRTILNFFRNAGNTGSTINLVFLEGKIDLEVGRSRAEGIHHEL